jgi:uncharacterized DUF497 family protein
VKIEEIIWLEEIVEKLWRKHRVGVEEVEEVFDGKPGFWFIEKGFRPGEDVYLALGRTDAGRYLSVFFIHKQDGSALIISARDMDQTERRKYGRT